MAERFCRGAQGALQYPCSGNSEALTRDIKVQKVSTRLDVPTSHNIKAGDILTDQAITIKGSPVAFSKREQHKLRRGRRGAGASPLPSAFF